MRGSKSPAPRNIISDSLLVKTTGKPLEHWYKLLDKKGAARLAHSEIYELISQIPDLESLGQWNWNLLATSYEWSRGLKARGERKDGIEISVSKTVACPISRLYDTWMNDVSRKKWLGNEKIHVRKATENKSARITWSDGATSLSVDFYTKGNDKSQVVVQHQKIQDVAAAEKLKVFWTQKLDALKSMIESK
jgi:hypothetical protein